MTKPARQFRISHHLLQSALEEKPGPHNPGSKRECSQSLPEFGLNFSHKAHRPEVSYLPSTESKDFSTLGKRKPDLGGSGLSAMNGDVVTPIIAEYGLNASGDLACAETAMSSKGFVKLYRDAEELVDNDPQAFLLLSKIAFRAIRKSSKYDKHNLKPGEAFIDDYKSIGLTRQQYRDVMDRLTSKYFLATFKGTNKGTIATLLTSELYDINSEGEEPTKNQPRTNKEPTAPIYKKNERMKEEEKTSKKSPRKTAAVDNAEALRLCLNFISLLEKTLPGLKLPSSMAKWQTEFDLMLRIDHRPVKDIEFLFEKMPGHFYSKNVQSAGKFREKFAVLMAYHTEQQSTGDTNTNRSWFLETKKDNARELRDWTASGEWVLNSRNSKELSLKMGHAEFKKAFLAAVGGKEIG